MKLNWGHGDILAVFVSRFDNKTGNTLEWYDSVWNEGSVDETVLSVHSNESSSDATCTNSLSSTRTKSQTKSRTNSQPIPLPHHAVNAMSSETHFLTPFEPVGLEFKSMPSGIHNMDQDCFYFRHDSLIGLAVFHRLMLPELMNNPSSRNAHMISVGALSYSQERLTDCLPFLQATAARLNAKWKEIFRSQSQSQNQRRGRSGSGSYDDYEELRMLLSKSGKRKVQKGEGEGEGKVGKCKVKDEDGDGDEDGDEDGGEKERIEKGEMRKYIDHEYNAKDLNMPSFIFPSPSLFSFFLLKFDMLVITIWKLLLLRRRILIFSPPPISLSCDFVSCICALLHGASPSMTQASINGDKKENIIHNVHYNNNNYDHNNNNNNNDINNHHNNSNNNNNSNELYQSNISKSRMMNENNQHSPIPVKERKHFLPSFQSVSREAEEARNEELKVEKDDDDDDDDGDVFVHGMGIKKSDSVDDDMSFHYRDDLPAHFPSHIPLSIPGSPIRRRSDVAFQINADTASPRMSNSLSHDPSSLPPLSPLFSVGLHDYDVLKNTSFYVACTTDAILKHKTKIYDVLIEQRDGSWKVSIVNSEMKKIASLTPNDKLRWKQLKSEYLDKNNNNYNHASRIEKERNEDPSSSFSLPFSHLPLSLFLSTCPCCFTSKEFENDEVKGTLQENLIENDEFAYFMHFNPLDRISTMNIGLGELITYCIENNIRLTSSWKEKPSIDFVRLLQEAKMDHKQDVPFLQHLLKMNGLN